MGSTEDFDFRRYGIMSFPIYWGQQAWPLWTNRTTQNILTLIGTTTVALSIYKFGLFAWGFLRPSTLQRYCHSQTGSWALVTGASDGIGRAFAEELLARGFNVLLHGRNTEKLKALQQTLEGQHPRRSVDYVVADASRPDRPENAVVEKVKQLPGKLTILVNNVGGVHSYPQYVPLSAAKVEDIDAMLNVNLRFTTQITRALLPTLQANKPALVANCSSVGGIKGVPYVLVYSATKAYIHHFSTTLASELVCDGVPTKDIEVKGFMIGNTTSAGNPHAVPLLTLSSNDCAKGCLAKVGSRNVLEFPSWRHWLHVAISGYLPDSVVMAEMKKRREAEVKGQ